MLNDRMIIPVMHCFDNNYVIPAAASFYSMLEHANSEYYYKLYVLHSDITIQNQIKLIKIVAKFPNASLEFLNMSNRFDELWNELQFSGHYSKEVLYKLLVSSIFPQYDKIIITDVDVVFLGDISDSYFALNTEAEVYFAGVRQVVPKGSWLDGYYKNYEEHFGKGSIEKLKICGGYLIANLRKLRENEMEEKFIPFLRDNAYRLLQSEQDVINFCCEDDHVLYLPLNNVVCTYLYEIFNEEQGLDTDRFYSREQLKDAMEHPIQLHYATGVKPWNSSTCTKADIWYTYLIKSGMYYDFMNKNNALKNDCVELLDNEVIRKGEPKNNSPMVVSVLCCTYNHENFIRSTLDGILMQKTDFPFEIIIADDASTDNTAKIIQEYYEKYPRIIKPILREENVGIGLNYYDALTKISGRFLAICDGDDEWIDSEKLQKQVEFFKKNPDFNVCCSACVHYNVAEKTSVVYKPNEYIASAMEVKGGYTFKDLLYCRFIASCTVMMRWQLRNRIPEFIKFYKVIDFPLALIHAAGGKIGVLNDEVFARYNIHGEGISSKAQEKIEQEAFCVIQEVNEFFDYRFSKTILKYFADLKCYKEYEKKKNIFSKTKSIVEHENNMNRSKFDILFVIYNECVPNIIKRMWRLLKKIMILLYMECVPNILKRGYRWIKKQIKRFTK